MRHAFETDLRVADVTPDVVVDGVGAALPLPVVLSLIAGQYVVKVAVTAADTPLVYAVTSA